MSGADRGRTVVLVPVRGFDGGKSRLAPHLPPAQRQRLLVDMAGAVLAAARHLPTAVVTGDPRVARWARRAGALVLDERGRGLDAVVEGAVADLAATRFDRVVVAHGDLPLADDLTWLENPALPEVLVVTDRRGDGTNVLAVPSRAGFRCAYGPASSQRHEAEARRLGLQVAMVRDPLLGWDVDVREDLTLPEGAELDRMRRLSAELRRAALPARPRAR